LLGERSYKYVFIIYNIKKMISIAKQTVDFYLKNFKTPKVEELDITDKMLLEKT
jgi:hypothetical protein